MASMPSRTDALCIGLLLVVGTSLCMQVFASGKWGARPSTEDEFVYLFQAKTLAAGRLTYPSPPLPEFFEAAHILVTPRFAAKYRRIIASDRHSKYNLFPSPVFISTAFLCALQ